MAKFVYVYTGGQMAETPEAQRPALETELAEEHAVLAGGLPRAVELGVVDEIVSRDRTRSALASALASAQGASVRRGRHGNIPL